MANEQPKGLEISTTITEFRRDSDFVARYANNVQAESTGFDLKLVFGILDQSRVPRGGPLAVDQHTAVNISWPEVKLLIFYLQLHLAGHEKENGKVKIPANALPAEPPVSIPPQFDNPQAREAIELVRKMRADFIAKQSEI